MEAGFLKADSNNLPKIDVIMLCTFFSSNTNFCSAEFRNIKSSVSSRASYGDDAISYVQLKRDGQLCTVKCKICPEHRVRSKLYNVTLIVNEEDDIILSAECHDCVASQGGCKHAIAFLMWVHRRSEEPSCTSTECYWRKAKLAQVGSNIKCITTKEMVKSYTSLASNERVVKRFLEEGRKRKLEDCEFLKYRDDSYLRETASASMHQLVFNNKQKFCELFLKNWQVTDILIKNIEKETRNQHKSRLWYELRYGRITASRAYEVSRCSTYDGTLISMIMGGQIPDSPAMKRGRILEDAVRETLELKLQKKIKKCGLLLCKQYPMIAGSPDGIFDDHVVEIKCPASAKTYSNFIKDGKPCEKYYTQMQIQMYLTNMKKCIFCVADPEFHKNKKIETFSLEFNDEFVKKLITENLLKFWKSHVYPLLYQSVIKTRF